MNPDRNSASDVAVASGEDFATMFEQSCRSSAVTLTVGTRVRAKVIHIGKENVFCELSPTQEGAISRAELVDGQGNLTVALGDTVDAFVISDRDGIELSRRLGREVADIDTLMHAAHSRLPVEGLVTGVNRGGLEVQIGGVRAFCPSGQVDLNFVEGLDVFVGKTLQFLVKDVRNNGRDVVLSRRALLEAERAERAAQTLKTIAVGQCLSGTISRLADFGAFVDLGGVDGLIPISEISHVRIKHPSELLKQGESVTVKVLGVEQDPKRPQKPRIALSLKSMLADPMDEHAAKLVDGAVLTGRVTRLEKYGAFVELFAGVEGMAHISEISDRRIRHPADVLNIGDEVRARILGVDRNERRISLSLREPADSGAAVEEAATAEGLAALQSASAPRALGTLGDLLKARARKP